MGVPEPQRGNLAKLRSTLREILLGAVESLSYRMPAFKLEGKTIAGYGATKEHCSYYPHTASILPTLGPALDGYDWSPGALHFPVDEELPRQLVEMLVECRFDQLGLS